MNSQTFSEGIHRLPQTAKGVQDTEKLRTPAALYDAGALEGTAPGPRGLPFYLSPVICILMPSLVLLQSTDKRAIAAEDNIIQPPFYRNIIQPPFYRNPLGQFAL